MRNGAGLILAIYGRKTVKARNAPSAVLIFSDLVPSIMGAHFSVKPKTQPPKLLQTFLKAAVKKWSWWNQPVPGLRNPFMSKYAGGDPESQATASDAVYKKA